MLSWTICSVKIAESFCLLTLTRLQSFLLCPQRLLSFESMASLNSSLLHCLSHALLSCGYTTKSKTTRMFFCPPPVPVVFLMHELTTSDESFH